MRSRDKLDVRVTQIAGKKWVKIHQKDGGPIVISFEDLFRVVRALLHCERIKYAGKVGKPSAYVRRFLNRCVDVADALDDAPLEAEDYEAAWLMLADEFEMPSRAKQPEAKSTQSGAR